MAKGSGEADRSAQRLGMASIAGMAEQSWLCSLEGCRVVHHSPPEL